MFLLIFFVLAELENVAEAPKYLADGLEDGEPEPFAVVAIFSEFVLLMKPTSFSCNVSQTELAVNVK